MCRNCLATQAPCLGKLLDLAGAAYAKASVPGQSSDASVTATKPHAFALGFKIKGYIICSGRNKVLVCPFRSNGWPLELAPDTRNKERVHRRSFMRTEAWVLTGQVTKAAAWPLITVWPYVSTPAAEAAAVRMVAHLRHSTQYRY